MTWTTESACDWCHQFGVLTRFYPEEAEHQEWICEDCQRRFEQSWDSMGPEPEEL